MNIERLISELLSSPLLIVAAIVPILPFLKFIKEIFIDFEVSRFRKVMNTKSYEDGLSTPLKEALIDERDKVTFIKIYGIDVDKNFRNIILNIDRDSSTHLTINDFKLAYPFLNFKDNIVYINFNIFLYLGKKKTQLLCLIYFILGFFFFIISTIYIKSGMIVHILKHELSVDDFFVLSIIGIIYIFISYSYFRISSSIESTIKIVKNLESWEQHIKTKEDWIGKYILRKIGTDPRSLVEKNY